LKAKLSELTSRGSISARYSEQVSAYLSLVERPPLSPVAKAPVMSWRSLLLVTSVALVSAYSLAWHCVNVVARAVVSSIALLANISGQSQSNQTLSTPAS